MWIDVALKFSTYLPSVRMNEFDDYNFCTAENSNLSSLFGNESSFDIGNSSLVYKAPKQPTNVESKDVTASPTKFYYKYITLYEIIAETEHEFGKYITGLMSSDMKSAEILIYQNKKNILIRGSIYTYSVSLCTKNFSLNLMIGERKWILEFMSKGDYTEFVSEFSKLGGKILTNSVSIDQSQKSVFKKRETSCSELNINCSEPDFSTKATNQSLEDESVNDSNRKDVKSNREKEEILTRLAKIGLPLLPSLNRETETKTLDDGNVASEERENTVITKNSSASAIKHRAEKRFSYENNQQLVNIQKHVPPIIDEDRTYALQENNNIGKMENQIQTLNSNIQIDPISLILAENRITNTELKQYMSLLSCKIDLVTNSKQSDEPGVQKQLKSKIRSLEIKSENLGDDLKRCQCKCNELEKINVELAFKLENIQELKEETTCTDKRDKSSQINIKENKIDIESINYKSQLVKVLEFIKCLPLDSVEFNLTQLNAVKDSILDDELLSNFDTCIHFLQEKMCSQNDELENIDKMRNIFIRTTKKIMFDMYSTVSSSLSENSNTRNILTEQVRSVTAELVRNFDKSVQNTSKHSVNVD